MNVHHLGLRNVEVYRNLHKGCYSIRHKGRVIAHAEEVSLEGASFVIQKAGQARTRREGKKCVHAFVRGTLTYYVPLGSDSSIYSSLLPTPITYNPYTMDTFQTRDGRPVAKAARVLLGRKVFEAIQIEGFPEPEPKAEPEPPFALSSFDEAFQPEPTELRYGECLEYEARYGIELY